MVIFIENNLLILAVESESEKYQIEALFNEKEFKERGALISLKHDQLTIPLPVPDKISP